MKALTTIKFLTLAVFAFTSCNSLKMKQEDRSLSPKGSPSYAIALHGGAGVIKRSQMTPAEEAAYLSALDSALTIGEQVLAKGGTSLEAVEQTIVYLEDCPLFNAGKGAVMTHEGRHELDASIMDGTDLSAGAVGGTTIIKNPIRAAIAVMRHSSHVMLTGAGANQFAIEQGLDTVSNSYFFTKTRYEALQKALKTEDNRNGFTTERADWKFGTVGCVALDSKGNLAAGTSTGGMTNKRWNRLGDSPIIGAGTYAKNKLAAVSCTGHGEFFIRYAVAYNLVARMEYLKESLTNAANFIIHDQLKKAGAEGGLIAVDAKGNIAMPFNSDGMFRAAAKPGWRVVEIYK